MKTTDFLNEDFVNDAHEAHQDHEVQMARSDCYNAAKYAIELHKLLKEVSEETGLDGWVSEKITLANDYLRTVTEYLRYEQRSMGSGLPEFDPGVATQTLDASLGEGYEQGFADPKSPDLNRRPQDHRGLGQELANERNNYAVDIDGKLWKVFADQRAAENIARSLRNKGKKVDVYITGASATVKESAGGMGAGSVATSMGGGNGFANGGPGTVSRPKTKKAKK